MPRFAVAAYGDAAWRGALLLALSGALLLTACGSDEAEPTPGPSVRRVATTDALAVLRLPKQPRDQLDVDLAQTYLGRFGVDPKAARLALIAHGAPLYVAPSQTGYCIVDMADVMSNCWTAAVVRRGNATMANLCSIGLVRGTIQLGGIVPDGIRRVTVIRRRFSSTTVKVINNVFIAVLPAGNPLPLLVKYHGRGPTGLHPSGIPRGTKQPDCVAHDRRVRAPS